MDQPGIRHPGRRDKQTLALHFCGDHYALSDFALGTGQGNPYYISSQQDRSTHADAAVDETSPVMTFSERLRPAVLLRHHHFAVTKGSNDDTVTVANVVPTISCNTVEITLSPAVTASDTNIQVSCNKPTPGARNRIANIVNR